MKEEGRMGKDGGNKNSQTAKITFLVVFFFFRNMSQTRKMNRETRVSHVGIHRGNDAPELSRLSVRGQPIKA